MSTYTVTIIKTGNSYALRVPKQYIDDGKLVLGQKASIALPTPQPRQNRAHIQRLLKQLQEINAYRGIGDPVAWQRDIRQDRPLPGRN